MRILLIKPIITEKSMKLAAKGIYTFLVNKTATKPLIAIQIANKFNVKVLSVKTINVKGGRKMQRQSRGYFQTPGFKKAMVQVGKDQKIGLFETQVKESEAQVTTVEGEQIISQKQSRLRGTKVKVEKMADVPMQTTQRKVITGK
ncbi:MAG: 50S ribosomal protein L23 [Candidatus Daviesbacteria bacterium]|nr:50S ribosomal protein L23 [Candidatus Daviesbacteria bacterium]